HRPEGDLDGGADVRGLPGRRVGGEDKAVPARQLDIDNRVGPGGEDETALAPVHERRGVHGACERHVTPLASRRADARVRAALVADVLLKLKGRGARGAERQGEGAAGGGLVNRG